MTFKLIANWSIPNERSLNLAAYSSGLTIAQLMSTIFIFSSASTATDLSTWKIMYCVNTAIVAVGAIPFLTRIPDSPLLHPRMKAAERALIEGELRDDLCNPTVSFDSTFA